jgi:hypothetical protein
LVLVLDLCTKRGRRSVAALPQEAYSGGSTKLLKNNKYPEAAYLCAGKKVVDLSRLGEAFGGFSTELSTEFVNSFKPQGRALI